MARRIRQEISFREQVNIPSDETGYVTVENADDGDIVGIRWERNGVIGQITDMFKGSEKFVLNELDKKYNLLLKIV